MRMTDRAGTPREHSPKYHFAGELPVIFACYSTARILAALQTFCKQLAKRKGYTISWLQKRPTAGLSAANGSHPIEAPPNPKEKGVIQMGAISTA